MDASVEVAIVGVAPYGLSLAGHLAAAGVKTRIFGRPMSGLYFISPAAAASFGPMIRFTFGACYVARRLTRALVNARRVSESKIPAPSTLSAPSGSGL